jgi:S-adenosylmethionine decarboxylase
MMRAMHRPVVGQHLLVELGGCDPGRLDDPQAILALIRGGAAAAGTRLLSEAVHRFEPVGVTGFGLLAESHLAVHTWPERGYAAIDLMTCRTDTDVERVVAYLRQALGAASAEVRLIDRRVP